MNALKRVLHIDEDPSIAEQAYSKPQDTDIANRGLITAISLQQLGGQKLSKFDARDMSACCIRSEVKIKGKCTASQIVGSSISVYVTQWAR
jgi:hypothetical protein